MGEPLNEPGDGPGLVVRGTYPAHVLMIIDVAILPVIYNGGANRYALFIGQPVSGWNSSHFLDSSVGPANVHATVAVL